MKVKEPYGGSIVECSDEQGAFLLARGFQPIEEKPAKKKPAKKEK